MKTYFSTKTGWSLFINPSSEGLLLLIKKISEAQNFYPDFSFRLEVIDFYMEERVLFYVPGWGREELLEFWGEIKL
jgi:hypothetical protein